MKILQVTKERAVERVTPLSLLGYTKGVEMSEIENGVQLCAESLFTQKAQWRTGLFLKYAHRLLGCSEQIFANRDVFNTLIPIKVLCCSSMQPNIFAPYIVQPTLGQFAYWWQTYKCSRLESEGILYPIVCWSVNLKFMNLSSSFTERNSLLCIDSDGGQYSSKMELHNLYNLSKSFHEVCKLYPATEYLHFDLEDAIEYLLGEKIER